MNVTFQIVLLVALAVYFFTLGYLLKKNRMTLKYSLLWMLVGVVMLFIAVFPKAFMFMSRLIGVEAPPNALFAVLFFCTIVLLMFLTAVVSGQSLRITRLTQSLATLEKRVRELEQQLPEIHTPSDKTQDEESV